jgi:hypothetical protein
MGYVATLPVMKHYIFKGDAPVFIPEIGTVKPGDTLEVEQSIKHPDFETINKEEAAKGKQS